MPTNNNHQQQQKHHQQQQKHVIGYTDLERMEFCNLFLQSIPTLINSYRQEIVVYIGPKPFTL